MSFDMVIEASEFCENKLKVLSSVPLKVLVKKEEQVLEEFTTTPDKMIYSFSTELEDGIIVMVSLIPGQIVEFYPVVNAL